MGGWALKLAGPALALALLLPWFYGTSDGDELSIAGWDTEPGFTLGMLACAAGIGVAGVVDRPLVALLSAAPAVALTIWMLPRGDLYSGYDLGPGGFVALAIAVLTVTESVRRLVRR